LIVELSKGNLTWKNLCFSKGYFWFYNK
jgi:hypothetical protein